MTRNISSVSPKGQVTIPIEIREEFGIEPKDKVLFDVDNNVIVIRPLSSPVDALYQSVAAMKTPLTWMEVRSAIRDEVAFNAANEGDECLKSDQ